MPEMMSLVLERNGEKDGFAERFGQSLPKGSFVFMEGGECSGKSIFAQRFCQSFLTNDYSCSYISTQFTVKRFLRQTSSVGYEMREHLLSGKLLFISTEVTLAETHPKETFLDSLLMSRGLFEKDIIFIDSLSTLLSESLTEDNIVELKNFFNRLTGSGKIIFASANPAEWSESIHRAFCQIADMHCKIAKENMPGIGVVHNIYIEKFNGATKKYEPMTTFSVKPDVGLAIESSGVAF